MCLRRKSPTSIWVGRVFESFVSASAWDEAGGIVFNVQIELDNTLRCNCASRVSTVELACSL